MESSTDPQPPRPRVVVMLEGTVIGILLFLAVTSVAVRIVLVFAQ
jgi:hypothetical protein